MNMITLDDMGMAEIEVDGFGANAGDRGRIRVGTGMMRVEHTFTFSDPTQMPGETTAPTGGAFSVLLTSITVTWDPGSAESTDVIKVALFNEGVTELVGVAAFRASSDPGIHTFTGVASGSYTVGLAAVRADGTHALTLLPDVVTIN